MFSRISDSFKPVHIFNIHTKDNHQEAAIGSHHALTLVEMVQGETWEDELDKLMENFQRKTGKTLLHSVAFY